MHELALAEAIVAIARDHARGRRVTGVEVKVGRLRQALPETLSFAFDIVAQGTNAEGASLAVEHVPVRVECGGCGVDSEATAIPLACAACGSGDVTVTGGDELLVESLELEDDPVAVDVEASRGISDGVSCDGDATAERLLEAGE